MTYVSSTPDAGTTFTTTTDPVSGDVTGGLWEVPTIAKNQTLTLIIDVIANAGGLSYNEITITKTDTWDPVSSNNSSKTPTEPQDAILKSTRPLINYIHRLVTTLPLRLS